MSARTAGREVYRRPKTESRNAYCRRPCACRSEMKGAPERIDIALQVLEGAIVFDDVVSAGAFQLGGHLRGDHLHGVGLFQSTRRDQALKSHGPRRIDQYDRLELVD